MSVMYEPREDSFLLKKHIKDYAKGSVLEIGTGSGVLAKEASNYAKKVLAVDINKEAIKYAIKNNDNKNISYLYSDMFRNVWLKYDLIICNPPYLPEDKSNPDVALDGGKKGWEWSEKFFSKINRHLKKDGKVLFLFSSLTKKDKIDELIHGYGLEFKQINEESHFFEKLYVYVIQKTDLTKELESKGISKIKYFNKGKRGFIFEGKYRLRKVMIKTTNPNSKAFNRIQHEVTMLKKLNGKIGPKLLFYGKDYFVYRYIDGEFFQDYIRNQDKKHVKKVLDKTLEMVYLLDKLKINKEEMTRPIKHILIEKGEPHMIDFERATPTDKPKNLSQFVQFLLSKPIIKTLEDKGIKVDKDKIMETILNYKKKINKKDFNIIKKAFI